jgi:hypothetical protein
MYFPYLRGRQFELIALRELAEKLLLSDKIIPIIEPVKLSSTLTNTIKAFVKNDRFITVIENPKVGSLLFDAQNDETNTKMNILKESMDNDHVIRSILVDAKAKSNLEALSLIGIKAQNVMAICLNHDYLTYFEDGFATGSLYNVIPYEPSFRRVRGKRVLIDDKFAKQDRNTDYANKDDEFFSDDHLYCFEDGYIGFSDYSIVGDGYKEGGFAPYAVAIHIVYFNEDNSLRIKHFVSDTNEDISDPANKFYEAVTKLVEWNKTKKLNTEGIKALEDMQKRGAYPGLGVVKKLTIMHHLELMSRYLDGLLK